VQAGGWSDERMIKRYLRKLNARQGGMAQLFAEIGDDGRNLSGRQAMDHHKL
jgi:hypothetical protein